MVLLGGFCCVFCFVQVGKVDYENERQAPKGMEWKTWEGDKLPQKDDDDA